MNGFDSAMRLNNDVLVYDCPVVYKGKVSEITVEGFIRVKTERENRLFSKHSIYSNTKQGRYLLSAQMQDDADSLVKKASQLLNEVT